MVCLFVILSVSKTFVLFTKRNIIRIIKKEVDNSEKVIQVKKEKKYFFVMYESLIRC